MDSLNTRWDAPPMRRMIVFLFTLGVLILAKGQALIPGYAIDDYHLIESQVPWNQFVAQGRFTQLLIFEILRLLNIPATQTYWPGTFLLFVAFAASVECGINFVARERGSLSTHCIVGGIVAAYPYFTEYFTFRQAILPMSVAMGGLYVFLFSTHQAKFQAGLTPSHRRRQWILGTIGLVTALGAFQNVFPIALIIVLAAVVGDGFGLKSGSAVQALKRNKDAIAMAIAAALFYAMAFIAARIIFGASGEQRAELLSVATIPGRATQVLDLLGKLFLSGEPLVSALAKFTLLLTLLGYWALAIRTGSMPYMTIGAFFPLAIALSLAPVVVGKAWWPVPRAIFSYGFAIGFTVLLLGLRANAVPAFLKLLSGISVLFLCLHSAAVLNDQFRLNRWDLNKAGQIAAEIARLPSVSSATKIVMVGGTWYHSTRVRTVDGDLNSSAFIAPWSLKGLLRESSGIHWETVISAATHDRCGTNKWPAAGSVMMVDGTVVVCL